MSIDDVKRRLTSLTDLDSALPIHGCPNETRLVPATRLDPSYVPGHCVLRQANVDALWRDVEAMLQPARNRGLGSRRHGKWCNL